MVMARTVYIVDDCDCTREALALLLRTVEFEVVTFGTARTFLCALEQLEPAGPICLVTDVRMPAMSGLQLQDELRRLHYHLPVIFLSGHADVSTAVRAMRNGAVSFLEKPVNGQELIDLINGTFDAHARTCNSAMDNGLEAKRAVLSPRQREVFDLLMQGLPTKEVALRLNLSPRTVEGHRASILERLQAPSFAKLISDLLQHSGIDGQSSQARMSS